MSAQGVAHSNAVNSRGHNGTSAHSLLRSTSGTITDGAVTTRSTSGAITRSLSANYSSLQRNVQASHQFHAGAYQQPYGYESRHWGYGERLPRAYFGRDYWITDYAMYSLFAPEAGLVWVRVGGDVMLVNEYTGEIVQADYGEFY
jgi:Ni/Co efflux regulator RcnB